MKKRLCIIHMGLMFIIFNTVAADRIAVVNISNIFRQFPQHTKIAKQLENEFKDRAMELASIERDLQAKMQRLQRDSSVMNSNEQNELEKSMILQREIYTNKAEAFDKDKNRRQLEERNKILFHIQNAVKIVAIKGNYDVVIDANAVAYINNVKDITADVLKQIK